MPRASRPSPNPVVPGHLAHGDPHDDAPAHRPAPGFDTSSLRFLASVGEPLNPEAVTWGREAFGLPFHDNWWQTETGGILIANDRDMDIKPGSMGRPLPGIDAAVLVMRRLSGARVAPIVASRKLFEGAYSSGPMGRGPEEQALILYTDRGLVIVTGCAPPGVVDIVRQARRPLTRPAFSPVFLPRGGDDRALPEASSPRTPDIARPGRARRARAAYDGRISGRCSFRRRPSHVGVIAASLPPNRYTSSLNRPDTRPRCASATPPRPHAEGEALGKE
jgi:hypothetical protein